MTRVLSPPGSRTLVARLESPASSLKDLRHENLNRRLLAELPRRAIFGNWPARPGWQPGWQSEHRRLVEVDPSSASFNPGNWPWSSDRGFFMYATKPGLALGQMRMPELREAAPTARPKAKSPSELRPDARAGPLTRRRCPTFPAELLTRVGLCRNLPVAALHRCYLGRCRSCGSGVELSGAVARTSCLSSRIPVCPPSCARMIIRTLSV